MATKVSIFASVCSAFVYYGYNGLQEARGVYSALNGKNHYNNVAIDV